MAFQVTSGPDPGAFGNISSTNQVVPALLGLTLPYAPRSTGGTSYWVLTASGAVYPFGNAASYGSAATALRAPIVGMAATPDGLGYWLVAADGGVFTFGDAGYFGSTGGLALRQPVVGMTPDGGWQRLLVGGVRRRRLHLW